MSVRGEISTSKRILLAGANANVNVAAILAAKKIVSGRVELVIPANGVVYGTTGNYALDCIGIPAGVKLTITNFGLIGGAAGPGGAGGYWYDAGWTENGTTWATYAPSGGGVGGAAIRLGGPTTVKNLGKIYGGGDGMGGSAAYQVFIQGSGGEDNGHWEMVNGSPGTAGAGTNASGLVSSGGYTWGVNGVAIAKNGHALTLVVAGDIRGGVG